MAKRKNRNSKYTYNEIKTYMQQKKKMQEYVNTKWSFMLSDNENKQMAQELVAIANIRNIREIGERIDILSQGWKNGLEDFRARLEGKDEMREWAVIKHYYDLVNEGSIKPQFSAVDDYHRIYAWVEDRLSIDEMKQLADEAEQQYEVRKTRLRKAYENMQFSEYTDAMKFIFGDD